MFLAWGFVSFWLVSAIINVVFLKLVSLEQVQAFPMSVGKDFLADWANELPVLMMHCLFN